MSFFRLFGFAVVPSSLAWANSLAGQPTWQEIIGGSALIGSVVLLLPILIGLLSHCQRPRSFTRRLIKWTSATWILLVIIIASFLIRDRIELRNREKAIQPSEILFRECFDEKIGESCFRFAESLDQHSDGAI